MNKQEELFGFAGQLRQETELAYLVFDGTREFWLPKSLTKYDENGTFIVPEWFAIKEGIA